VFDAIRPHTNELWAALPERERARLLRHVARHWEVHRHRMAPQIAARVDEVVESGRLRISRGVVANADPAPGTWIVNCTGPNFDLSASPDPLIRDLLTSGRARPGHCGQGFDTAPDGRLVDRIGTPSAQISTIGPLRRGTLWETSAIPEIRAAADDLVARLDRSIRRAEHAAPMRIRDRAPLRAVTSAFVRETRFDNELHELLASVVEHTDLHALAPSLPTAPGLRSWLRLATTEHADAWLIAWGEASQVGAHDHGGSRGAIRVLVGDLVETYREPTPRGRWRRRAIGAGQSIELPTSHVHSVSNPGAGPALSLHVYSPPLASMNFVPAARTIEVSA
jgi:hypothetical protein